MLKLFIFSLTLFSFYEINAYAYLDPGTGSIIIQALVSAFAATATFLYYYGNKVKDFFKRFKKDNNEDNNKDKK
tara:strand:+ start:757 stop:978 length:222 start_codon:yes stop_codon:yes gene_type:complete